MSEIETTLLNRQNDPCKVYDLQNRENGNLMFVNCCKESLKKNIVANVDCTLPSIEEFTISNLTFCKDQELSSFVFWELNNYWNELSGSPGDFGCPVPCTQVSYNIAFEFDHKNKWFIGDLISDTGGSIDFFLLYLYFGTLDVEERIDNLDYDFESFLAAVGGNLGLFLGFSCLSVLLTFVRVLNRFKA